LKPHERNVTTQNQEKKILKNSVNAVVSLFQKEYSIYSVVKF